MEILIISALGLAAIALAAFAIGREVWMRKTMGARAMDAVSDLRDKKTG